MWKCENVKMWGAKASISWVQMDVHVRGLGAVRGLCVAANLKLQHSERGAKVWLEQVVQDLTCQSGSAQGPRRVRAGSAQGQHRVRAGSA